MTSHTNEDYDPETHTVNLGDRIAVYKYNETLGCVQAIECCDSYFTETVPIPVLRDRIKGLQKLLKYAVEKEKPKLKKEIQIPPTTND